MFGASPGKITHSLASSTNAECTTLFLCTARGRRAAQHAAEADGRGLQPHEQSRATPTW
jgi:hypothetical protein